MPNNRFSITLRCPSQHADHVILCEANWSVLKLKQVIHESYPGNPELSEQRLIYGGKYLCNHETLSSVLKVTNSPQIIHLVLVGSPYSESNNSTSNAVPGQTDGTSSSSFPYPELRQRRTANTALPEAHAAGNVWPNVHTSPAAAAGSVQQPTPYATPPPYSYTNEQYAAMWDQYQRNMNNYMQYYAQQNTQQPNNINPNHSSLGDGPVVRQIPPPSMPQQPVAAAPPNDRADAAVQNDPIPAVAPNDPPPARRPRGNPPNDNVAMNAQGGFAADDVHQHDWLDVLFTMFRYCFFFSIIYFYSTVKRFILVSGLCLIFYLCRSGIFRAQRRPRRRSIRNQRNNARAPRNTDDNNNEDDMDNQDEENEFPNQRPPPPSIFATAWCFIRTFFTSLIPQPTPVL